MPTPRSAGQRYRVLALEPDERFRTRMTLELAGIASAPTAALDDVLAQLVPGEPIVVLFGPSLATDDGFATVQRITRAYPEVGIVLLAEELTLPLLQQALRSGVRDAVTVDAGESQIRQAIERVGDAMAAMVNRAALAQEQQRGQVVVSFSTKGGVGKSVVSTNIAVTLATHVPGRVALVDADLQFGDVAVLLGIPPLHTTSDAAAAVDTADEQLMDGLLATHDASSLRVLCAPVEPSAGDRITPEEMIAIVRQLRTMFDYIVVDMPPHFDDVVLALIEEADHVLLVASMDIPSIKNLKVGIQTLDLLALAGGEAEAGAQPCERPCAPRRLRRRARARCERGVSHPFRHRGSPGRQPGRCRGARQTSCTRRAGIAFRRRELVVELGCGDSDGTTGRTAFARNREPPPAPALIPTRVAGREVATNVSAVFTLAGLAAGAERDALVATRRPAAARAPVRDRTGRAHARRRDRE
jgi:pilus assembly protein CpaE